MTVMALAMSGVLLALAAIHVLWAIGFWWPIRDEDELVSAAVGLRGATRMPGPIPCSLVAVGLIAGAWWPWLPDGVLRQLGLGVLATVFVIRGFLPWRPVWRSLTSREPFATYDRRYYGPICLGLGAGFTVLFLKGV